MYEYKLIWNDGVTKGEQEIIGDYDYVLNEWDKVRYKYPYAKMIYFDIVL